MMIILFFAAWILYLYFFYYCSFNHWLYLPFIFNFLPCIFSFLLFLSCSFTLYLTFLTAIFLCLNQHIPPLPSELDYPAQSLFARQFCRRKIPSVQEE